MSKKAQLKIEINYAYTRLRSQFGKRCTFSDRPAEVNANIPPDETLLKHYITREQSDKGIDASPPTSLQEVNTTYIEKINTGINHTEGGWPKDVNCADHEQTVRYRKKIEKEESFSNSLRELANLMEHYVMQNNAIDIYEQYFLNDPPLDDPPEIGAVLAYPIRDPCEKKRPVSGLSWHPVDGAERIAVAHCVLDFQRATPDMSNDSYIWRTENPFKPEIVLTPQFPLLNLSYCYKDQTVIAGGAYNGQVVFFDIRRSNRPTEKTALPVSHGDPVYDVIWIQSKTGFECFSTSTDGQVLWWDMRNLSEAVDQMTIDPSHKNDIKVSEGGTVLDYEPTIPTKFMVGTEAGNVYSCTRRAKMPGEKMGVVYSNHFGPVYQLARNPFFPKLFLTVGDYRIWSEEVTSSPIWFTPYYNVYPLHAVWSPQRPYVFLVSKSDGTLDIWDIMFQQKRPEATIKLCNDRMYCVCSQDAGEFVGVGGANGTTYVMKMASGVYEMQKNERSLMLATMEREVKRERIVEGKERERKLAAKKAAGGGAADQSDKFKDSNVDQVDLLEETCTNFYSVIKTERRKLDKESSKITGRPLRFPEPEKPTAEKKPDGEVQETDSIPEFGDLPQQPPLQTDSEIELDRYMTTPPPGRVLAGAIVPSEHPSPFDFDEYEREFGESNERRYEHPIEQAPPAPAPPAKDRKPMSSEREVNRFMREDTKFDYENVSAESSSDEDKTAKKLIQLDDGEEEEEEEDDEEEEDGDEDEEEHQQPPFDFVREKLDESRSSQPAAPAPTAEVREPLSSEQEVNQYTISGGEGKAKKLVQFHGVKEGEEEGGEEEEETNSKVSVSGSTAKVHGGDHEEDETEDEEEEHAGEDGVTSATEEAPPGEEEAPPAEEEAPPPEPEPEPPAEEDAPPPAEEEAPPAAEEDASPAAEEEAPPAAEEEAPPAAEEETLPAAEEEALPAAEEEAPRAAEEEAHPAAEEEAPPAAEEDAPPAAEEEAPPAAEEEAPPAAEEEAPRAAEEEAPPAAEEEAPPAAEEEAPPAAEEEAPPAAEEEAPPK